MQQLILQSHRGGGALTPENTLESFVATWDLGAIPEADLRTTKDGVIVAFHDKNFARVVKDAPPELRDKGVADVTFAELAALDVGSWQGAEFVGQRVRSVAEIFALMQGRPERALYLDIKDVRLPQLAAQAREYGVTERVILAAPNERLLREWMNLVSEGQTLLWMGILWRGNEDTLRQRLDSLRETDFDGITQLQIHVGVTPHDGGWHYKPSPEFLRAVAKELEAHGVLFQALPWECAEAEVYRDLLEAGVQSFASDYPAVALQALRAWAAAHPY